jgi:TRAP transporter TAXI family solute receptor
MKSIFNLSLIVSFLCNFAAYADDGKRVIKIGTGSKSALAYPIVSTICDIFNRDNEKKHISCVAVETGGAVDNLNGIIKADMEYNAYNGIGVFAGKPYRDLRTIIGLHKEYLTIVVKKKSGITSLKDVKNKRIYIGNKGSGSRILVDKLFSEIGWKNQDFKEIHEESADQIHDLFCKGKIDAAIYLIGHPNSIFLSTLAECDTKMINFSRKEIEKYVDVFRYLYPALIDGNTYPRQEGVRTFASQLLLATSTRLEEEVVYDLVKAIDENHSELVNKNPALSDSLLFSPEINVIPLHKGTMRYYYSSN